MIRRALAFAALVWALGFVAFALTLPGPLAAGAPVAEAVVVPTGGEGRIARGLTVLDAGGAPVMLVTGVDPEVREPEFAEEFEVSAERMACCVTLGQDAADTRGNAAETAAFAEAGGVTRLRLVTTDWHMRRAAGELERALPPGTRILRDGVRSSWALGTLFLEYHKLIASWLVGVYGRATA